jgi:hypothetical protein
MLSVHDGQCGLCKYYGNHGQDEAQIEALRKEHQGPETLVEDCEHPKLAPLNLQVTPISGCSAFELAAEAGSA